MIDIQKVSVSYGKHKVLKSIDLHLGKGECVALIGPNGSGKTTLIKCLLSLVKPDEGSITFREQPIFQQDNRKNIGYMPQVSRFPEHMKAKQLFKLIKELRRDQKDYDMEMYELLEIDKFAHRPLGVLSEGMKQKVNASLAFLFKPDVLILDEPTASLDPVANQFLKQKIIQLTGQGKLVLISSHILSDLDEISTWISYLMNGELWLDKSLKALQEDTNQLQLNKIISHLLQNKKHVQDY